jgi:hypothetical protein
MFATDAAAPERFPIPEPSEEPMPQGGLATGAFSRRVSATPPAESGPSEFTQMFAAPTPAPVAKSAEPKPAPAVKPGKSSLPLVLMLAGLFLLLVIVIVVFALLR